MEKGVEAAVHMARMSRELLMLPDEGTAMRAIVAKAVEAVEPCEDAVISERAGKQLKTVASTSGIAEACDELQHRRNEGPSVEVAWNTEVSLVSDAARETRWPELGRRVSDLGMASVLAIRLAAGPQMLGSLSFYSSTPEAYDAAAIAIAFSFATHAAVALFSARQSTAFTHSVEARHTIGMAQGILMARYGLDRERAFDLLRRFSNQTNTKLRDVAQQVTDHRGLPRGRDPEHYLGGTSPPRQRGPDRAQLRAAPRRV